MTSLITQCPKCRTRFHVNQTQLTMARGLVRCGACMTIFNAQTHSPDHIEHGKAASESDTTLPTSAAPLSAEQEHTRTEEPDELWVHDDLNLNGLDLEKLDLDQALSKLIQEEHRPSYQTHEHKQANRTEKPFTADAKEINPFDECWAEARTTPAKPFAENPPAEKPHQNRDNRQEPDLSTIASAAATLSSNTVGKPGNSLLVARKTPEINTKPQSERPDPPISALDEPALPQLKALKEKPENSAAERLAALYIEEERIPRQRQPRRKPRRHWFAWTMLSLVLALAIGGQYVFRHFDELARMGELRPWFEKICPWFDCQLPIKIDISQIKSSNLVIRRHPDFKGALIADAILYNRATFAQPFPTLELRFADINSQPIASRRYHPSEYLSGELTNQAKMPPQTPIHIRLDVLDPGENAVNYSLNFLPPE
ncbi:zinc-ribbon and DUF3426 domain-containing protein [Azomonas macrocytogenes]|nr:zinc-ribbon and DUF3426 domain-containing protein [Azomonas macrocytogenes]